jgi:hypothetical protein
MLAALLWSLAAVASVQPVAAVTPTLVGYWTMDEGSGTVAHDTGASPANDATTVGSPTWGSGFKVGSSALQFNGTSSTLYATTDDEASLNITDAITIAAWIKPCGGSGTERIVQKGVMGSTDGYELSLSTGGKVFFRLNQKTSADTYRVNSNLSYPVDCNTWMHVAATYNDDGTKKMKIYINGVLDNTNATGPAAILTNSGALAIGAPSDGSSSSCGGGTPCRYNGWVDDVRLYNYALSAAEIAALAPTLSGTITAGVTPVVATVSVFDSTTFAWAGNATSAADGTFSLSVPPGTYKLYLQPTTPGYPNQWYGGGGVYWSTATPVTVSGATSVPISLALSTLSGTITAGGTPVVATVSVFDSTTFAWAGNATSAADGTFSLSVPPGTYKLYLQPITPGYVDQWFGGGGVYWSTATPVTVSGATSVPISLVP